MESYDVVSSKIVGQSLMNGSNENGLETIKFLYVYITFLMFSMFWIFNHKYLIEYYMSYSIIFTKSENKEFNVSKNCISIQIMQYAAKLNILEQYDEIFINNLFFVYGDFIQKVCYIFGI